MAPLSEQEVAHLQFLLNNKDSWKVDNRPSICPNPLSKQSDVENVPKATEGNNKDSLDAIMARMKGKLPLHQSYIPYGTPTNECFSTDRPRDLNRGKKIESQRHGTIDSTGGRVLSNMKPSQLSNFSTSQYKLTPGNSIQSRKLPLDGAEPNLSPLPSTHNMRHQLLPKNPKYVNVHAPLSLNQMGVVHQAASKIQCMYRGYKVRKVTSHILKKNVFPLSRMCSKLNTVQKDSFQSSINCKQQSVLPTNTNFDTNDIIKNRGELLNLARIKPIPLKKYKVSNPKIPEHIRPIVEFVQTGNLEDFIDSRGKELEKKRNSRQNQIEIIARPTLSSHPERIPSQNNISNYIVPNKNLPTEDKDVQCTLSSNDFIRLQPRRAQEDNSQVVPQHNPKDWSINMRAADQSAFKIRVPTSARSRQRISTKKTSISETNPAHSVNKTSTSSAVSKANHSIICTDDTEYDQVSEIMSEIVDAAPPALHQSDVYSTESEQASVQASSEQDLVSGSVTTSGVEKALSFDPETAIRLAPSELRRRFDAEIEREEMANFALNHLQDLEKQREIEELRVTQIQIIKENQEERDRVNILKVDLDKRMKEDRQKQDKSSIKHSIEIEEKVTIGKKEIEKKAKKLQRDLEKKVREDAWEYDHKRKIDYLTQQTKLNFEKLSLDINNKADALLTKVNNADKSNNVEAMATATAQAWQRLLPISQDQRVNPISSKMGEDNKTSEQYTSSFVTSSASSSSSPLTETQSDKSVIEAERSGTISGTTSEPYATDSENQNIHSPSESKSYATETEERLPSELTQDTDNNYEYQSFTSSSHISEVIVDDIKENPPTVTSVSEMLDMLSSSIPSEVNTEISAAICVSENSPSVPSTNHGLITLGDRGAVEKRNFGHSVSKSGFHSGDLTCDDQQGIFPLPSSSLQADLSLKMTQAIPHPLTSISTADDIRHQPNVSTRLLQDRMSYSQLLDTTLSSLGEYLKEPHQRSSNVSFTDIQPTIDNFDMSLNVSNFDQSQSNLTLNSSAMQTSCLNSALSLLQTLQEEEDWRLQEKKNLLKMQMRSIMQEIKHKLSLLQNESPSSGRKKKQRAVVLSLREQWLNIRKVMESLELTSQKNKQMLAQHFQILANSSYKDKRSSMSASPKLLDDSTSNEDLAMKELFLKKSFSLYDNIDRKAFSEEETPTMHKKPRPKSNLLSPRRFKKFRKDESTESSGQPISSSEKEEEANPTEDKELQTKSHKKSTGTKFSFQSISVQSTHSQTEERATKQSKSSQCDDSLLPSSDEKSSDVDNPTSKKGGSHKEGFSVPLRVSLSPRSPHQKSIKNNNDSFSSSFVRYSSESDDSFSLSQNETSETSDGEGKLLALQEQLLTRKQMAEKLKKERKRVRKDKIASKEIAIKKQIAIYDSYIENARQDLEKEILESQKLSHSVRPVIKRPENRKCLDLSVVLSPEKSDSSEYSTKDASVNSKGSERSSDSRSISSNLESDKKIIKKLSDDNLLNEKVEVRVGVEEPEDEIVTNQTKDDQQLYSDNSSSIIEEMLDHSSEERSSESIDSLNTAKHSVESNSKTAENAYSSGTFENSSSISYDKKDTDSVSTEESNEQSASSATLVQETEKEDSSSIEEEIIDEAVDENQMTDKTGVFDITLKLPAEMLLESSCLQIDHDGTSDLTFDMPSREPEIAMKSELNYHFDGLEKDVEYNEREASSEKIDSLCDALLNELVKDSSVEFCDVLRRKSLENEKVSDTMHEEQKSPISNETEEFLNSSLIHNIVKDIDDGIPNDSAGEKKGLLRDDNIPPPAYPVTEQSSVLDPNELNSKLLAILDSYELESIDSEFESCNQLAKPCHPTLVVTTSSSDNTSEEVQQLLQLQFPGVVIRPVPDHPPPPYTPPPAPRSYSPPQEVESAEEDVSLQVVLNDGGRDTPIPSAMENAFHRRLSKSDAQALSEQMLHYVPHTKEEIAGLVKKAMQTVCSVWFVDGRDPSTAVMQSETDLTNSDDVSCSIRAFNLVLFDTVKNIICEQFNNHRDALCSNQNKEFKPWRLMNRQCTSSVRSQRQLDEATVRNTVTEQMEVLMGWRSPFLRESRMLQWVQRRRDPVDLVLVRELGTEENLWTNYETDEEEGKIKIADNMFQDLISGTIMLFKQIISKKLSGIRIKQATVTPLSVMA